MKKYTLLLLLIAVAIKGSFAQDLSGIKSEQEAVQIIRSSRFMQIYKSADCDKLNVERFVGEVEKIIPLEKGKKAALKGQLFNVAECEMIVWPVNRPPFIAEAVDDVLKNNFDSAQYCELSVRLIEKLAQMNSAYGYLSSILQQKEGYVPFGYPGSLEYIDMIYDYFDI